MGKGRKGGSPLFDHEARERLVKEGDVKVLYDAIATTSWDLVPLEAWRDLFRAIETQQSQDPTGFVDELLGSMLAFSTYVLMRTQYLVEAKIAAGDAQKRTRPQLSEEVTEQWLPRIERIHHHVVELAEAHARVRRLYSLAERSREEASPKKPRIAKPPVETPRRKTRAAAPAA